LGKVIPREERGVVVIVLVVSNARHVRNDGGKAFGLIAKDIPNELDLNRGASA
jgi:hypothetical protein